MNVAIKRINTVVFGPMAFWTMVTAVILMIFAYIYFVNAIVWHVASRQETEKKLSDLTTQMASLEAVYVGLTSNINIDHAYTLGFKDISSAETQFVKRSATLGALPMRQVQ